MTIDDDIESSTHPILARVTTVLLFLLLQAGCVVLVGLVALLAGFQPGWSAESTPAAKIQPPYAISAVDRSHP